MWFTAIKPRQHKKLPFHRVLLRLQPYSISISDRQTSYKSCAHTYNIRARTHTRCCKISTTRPPQPHNALCVCSLRGWSIMLTRGVRPPFDHPSTTSHLPLPSQKQLDQNSHQYTILHVLTTGNTLVKRWTRLLHNIWHHYFPIFETICFQRWKGPCLTLDNTLV